MNFIKRIVAALAFTGLAIGAASAADLPSKFRMPPAPIYTAIAPFSWTGFYAGINGGYVFNGTTRYGIEGYSLDHDMKGASAGVQAGFRQQFGSLVVGLEGTAQFGNIHASESIYDVNTTTRINQLYTITPTVGVAFDRVLVYGKAGWAGGNVRSGLNASYYDAFNWTNTKFHHGWTVGGGVEYAFTNHWTAGLEYNYIRLSDMNHNGTLFGEYDFAVKARPELHQALVKLNYKF